MIGRPWTPDERQVVVDANGDLTLAELSSLLPGRSTGALYHFTKDNSIPVKAGTVGGNSGWTDERVATLKRMWLAGDSAGVISRTIGGVTRSAVIGKVFRLQLSAAGRAAPSRPPPTASRPARPAPIPVRSPKPPRPAPPAQAPVPQVREPEVAVARETPREPLRLVSMLDLKTCACRFPFGDPKAQGFGFCGAVTADGESYCGDHKRAAHNGYGRTPPKELARSLRRFCA